MGEEQSIESDSTTEEVETGIKTAAQQFLIKPCEQLTLQASFRSTRKVSVAMEDRFGILVLGTSYHGPRLLLSIIRRPQDERMKVTQSALVQNSTELML